MVIGLLYLLFYVLIKQGLSFAKDFPEMYSAASNSIQTTLDSWRNEYSILPIKTREFLDMIVDRSGALLNYFIEDLTSHPESFHIFHNFGISL